MIMNGQVQELKYAVQALALPVTGQRHLHWCDGCRVEKLAAAFKQWQITDAEMTQGQTAVLQRLGQRLEQLVCEPDVPDWSDLSLRRSPRWRQVRHTAREALVLFGWPLDVPPETTVALAEA